MNVVISVGRIRECCKEWCLHKSTPHVKVAFSGNSTKTRRTLSKWNSRRRKCFPIVFSWAELEKATHAKITEIVYGLRKYDLCVLEKVKAETDMLIKLKPLIWSISCFYAWNYGVLFLFIEISAFFCENTSQIRFDKNAPACSFERRLSANVSSPVSSLLCTNDLSESI